MTAGRRLARDALYRNMDADILYVLPTEKLATDRWHELGCPENIHCVSVAANLAGTRFKEIWVDQDYIQVLEPRLWSKAEDQIELLYTRLEPGGRVRRMS